MNKKIHFPLLTGLTLLVMVISAVNPLAARADDSTPASPATQPPAADTSAPASVATQPPAADTSAPPADTSVAPARTSVAPTDTSVAPADTSVAPADTAVAPADTAVAPAATSAPATAVAPTDTSAAATTVASTDTTVAPTNTTVAPTGTTIAPTDTSTVVGAVPTGTSVVVLDATSTPVPLATQTAAAIVKTGDPMWCPTGVTPGSTGCTGPYSSLGGGSGLLEYLVANQSSFNQDGTVWIAASYDSSVNDSGVTSFTLDGNTNYGTMKNHALTIQGGWSGSSGNSTITGTSTFNGASLTIQNWNNDVTLNDITVENTGNDGLHVQTKGNITLHKVNSNQNHGDGAYLVNDAMLPTATGAIIISDSDFSKNGNDGLEAYSNGSITLTDVTADNNLEDGAYLDNCLPIPSGYCTNRSGKGVSVDNSTFGDSSSDGNRVNGLEVYSNGNVTLTDVTADGNDYDGALLGYNNYDTIFGEIGGNISVTGSDFSNNYDEGESDHPAGLEAYADGSIQVSGITAETNRDDGVYLENDFGSSTGGITVEASNFGESSTTGNRSDGLEAVSNGSITLTDVTADNNEGDGLDAFSSGTIALTSVTADHNTYNGASLSSCLIGKGWTCYNSSGNGISIDLTGGSSEFNNNTSTGYGFGLFVDTYGNVTLNNVKANGNEAGDGADIYDFSNLLIQDSFFNDNYSTLDIFGNGLYIASMNGSSVVLSNVQTSGDGSSVHADGTYVDISGQLTIDPSQFDDNSPNSSGLEAWAGNITITCSDLSNNDKYGVNANLSGGALTLNGDTLSGNGSGATNLSGGTLVTNSVNCTSGGGKGKAQIVGGSGPLPWNVVNVPDSGGQGTPLSCLQYVGTDLVLPNGDHALLPCPIGSVTGTSGSLRGLSSSNLPGTALNSKFTFVSALDMEVNPPLSGGMVTVSFNIPAGKQGANFAILHWDGTKWVNLGGSINPPGYFSITTSLTGDFVLVTQ